MLHEAAGVYVCGMQSPVEAERWEVQLQTWFMSDMDAYRIQC